MENCKLSEFFKEYKEYLVDTGRTSNTADQYCTYLRKAYSLLHMGEGFIEALTAISDKNVQAALCEYMMSKLSHEYQTAQNKEIKKHISNYRSAVSALSGFLTQEDIHDEKNIISLLPDVSLPFESVYDQKELVNKFKSRLGTQERYYYSDDASFSARVLNRIVTKNKKPNLYEKLILDTKFLYEADENKFYRLREITSLTIKKDGFVKMLIKGKEYDVYTQVYKDGKIMGFERLRVNSIELVSLDHIHSVHELYPKFLDSHNELRIFSKNVLKHRKVNSEMRIDKFATYYYNNVYPNISTQESVVINEDLLISEAREFIDLLELSIIHKSYNSSKNDN